MFSFPTFPSINQILNATHHFNYKTNYEERRMVVCHGPGLGSVCVCGWRGMSVEFLAALRPWTASWNQAFLSLVCLEQKEARSRSGPHRGFIFNHTSTTSSLSRLSTLFSGLCLSLYCFFRQIAAQMSEIDLCYRNTIWPFAGLTRSHLFTWNIHWLFLLSIIVSLLIFVLNCCCTFYLLVVFGAKEAQFIIPLLSYFIVDVNEM